MEREVPTILSPFVNDTTNETPRELSRSTVSLFESVKAQQEWLARSEFKTPEWYRRGDFRLSPEHLHQFSNDTLFYCFYYLPGDVLQALAAEELAARKWRYHVDLQRWFKPESLSLFFDPVEWNTSAFSTLVDQSKFLEPRYYSVPKESIDFSSLKTHP